MWGFFLFLLFEECEKNDTKNEKFFIFYFLFFIFALLDAFKDMKNLFLLIAIAAVLAGCSPKISSNLHSSHQPLTDDSEVAVLELNASFPENAEVLGQIKIGDSGFTTKNGSYHDVLKIAKDQARKVGGNVVKITEHKSPDLMSSIHRIKADILRVEDVSVLLDNDDDFSHSVHPDYAVIYFYRESGAGSLVTYDVHIGDTKVYRSRPQNKAEVKIYEDGEVEIWAKTEAKESFVLSVRKGADYYVRTGVTMGLLLGRPDLDVVSVESGKVEYESIKEK